MLARLAPAAFQQAGAREGLLAVAAAAPPLQLLWPAPGDPFDAELYNGSGEGGSVASVIRPGLDLRPLGGELTKAAVTLAA